jgi:hypothetical protein
MKSGEFSDLLSFASGFNEFAITQVNVLQTDKRIQSA